MLELLPGASQQNHCSFVLFMINMSNELVKATTDALMCPYRHALGPKKLEIEIRRAATCCFPQMDCVPAFRRVEEERPDR